LQHWAFVTSAHAPTESLLAQALSPGAIVGGRYVIEAAVGEGGIGQVYRAKHKFLRTTVAIKLLHPSADSRVSDSRRFEREAFALGKVAHDNCLAITDFGEHEGRPYLVTEFLDGRSLGDVAHEEGRFEVGRALDLLAQLLRALGHAHDQGVVHRDLKPDNIILIDRHGHREFVKVLDFGLAKLLGETLAEEGGGDLTQTGITFGTPRYMAPEQIVGGEIGPQTDLYAVSCIGYRLLSGRAPFEHDDPHDLLMAHCTEVAPSFAELGIHDIPPVVEEMIRRGLAKKPEDRFPDARAYLQAIDACFASAVSPATTRSIRKSDRAAHSAIDRVPPRVDEGPAPRQPKRRAWVPIAAIGATLVAIAIIAAVASSGPQGDSRVSESVAASDGDTDVVSADSDEYVFEEPGLQEVRALVDNGRIDAAIAKLGPKVKSGKYEGRAAFLLGTLYFRKMYWSDGFDAYAIAISRDPSYRSHPVVLANAVAGLGSRSKPHLAERFIRKHLGAEVLPVLDEAAANAKHKHHRERAAKLARELRR